jgi:beta-lactamase superfamily II metal-dependent hydrolase
LLEVNFVDVGQGDGCFIVTPGDDFLLVDAGEHDNMARFLSWRFNLRRHPGMEITFDAAVITHPDQDHYAGFRDLFARDNFHFKTLYHNGLVERAGAKRLGETTKADGVTYQIDLVTTMRELKSLLHDPANVGRLVYPNMLKGAVDNKRIDDARAAAAGQFLEGYEDNQDLSIEVVAPVPEKLERKTVLRRLGSDGITKNGHSVTLKLRYKDIDVLLTGDLNSAAERYLLQHYTGFDCRKVDESERDEMIAAARGVFEAHAAKSCHHGSADFVDEFLGGINALVTVVSSGDDEPFAHPRPDALGALGKWGRGPRPLIFSTELARLPRENTNEVQKLRDQIEGLNRERAAAESDLEDMRIRTEIRDRLDKLERAIAVYGLINLRTDGKKLLMAQKLERPAPSGSKWDVHRLEFVDGELEYVSD